MSNCASGEHAADGVRSVGDVRCAAVRESGRIPLTGADCMLRAFDREAKRFHSASHASQLVLRLGPGLEAAALRRLIEIIGEAAPIVRAPIRRRWMMGEPGYEIERGRRAPLPQLRVHEAAVEPEHAKWPPAEFTAALNEPFDGTRGELLRFDLVRHADGSSDLALTWLHMLLDGTGSESFVRAMAAIGDGAQPSLADSAGADAALAGLTLAERGRRARAWQSYLKSFANHPPRSPAGPLRKVAQRLRYRVETFDAGETQTIAELAGQKAGFLTPVLYYMAAAIRAHHRLFEERGAVPASYVVPLPVNIRPKGMEGAIFRTHVSMLWFQVRAAQADDFDALLSELKRQRLAAIRDNLVEGGGCAIEFARWMPANLFGRMVRRTFDGELCSFFFAFTGNFLAGVDTFLGAEVCNGFHVPAVPPSPGSCAAMSIHRGRLNLTHVYQEGALSRSEVDRFAEAMRCELLRGS